MGSPKTELPGTQQKFGAPILPFPTRPGRNLQILNRIYQDRLPTSVSPIELRAKVRLKNGDTVPMEELPVKMYEPSEADIRRKGGLSVCIVRGLSLLPKKAYRELRKSGVLENLRDLIAQGLIYPSRK